MQCIFALKALKPCQPKHETQFGIIIKEQRNVDCLWEFCIDKLCDVELLLCLYSFNQYMYMYTLCIRQKYHYMHL